ncbi:hypothetical protein SAMN05444411_106193 [Lutibacter oricola]|uniref:POU-specific domain-containing protein n=1 Tax=Lutibacter oricola TaxID=762486 RepID=A0A1H3CLH6_9FLAO|nr:hypothetical protein [Lutibacter oricola]SDX54758.1 hypothetical protein SAMN05444411_106193 [Lutibacter oricola]
MKKFILLFTLVLLFVSCGSTKQIAPSKYNPKFSYTPDQRTQISDNSLTVAVIDPVFSDGEDNNLVEPYASFVRNMADDFEETLNANGFKIKGPYKTRDEMVYGDKLNTDFAIELEVEILTEQGDFGKKSADFATQMMCKTCFKLGGTFYHKGRIILTATDPMDGEKFWKKTVDLDRVPVSTNGNLTFNGSKGKVSDEVIFSDTGIYNPVAKVLEAYYAETLSNLSRQIDPREMEQISKQIKAKRKRVGQ